MNVKQHVQHDFDFFDSFGNRTLQKSVVVSLTASNDERAGLPVHGEAAKHHGALGLDRQPGARSKELKGESHFIRVESSYLC